MRKSSLPQRRLWGKQPLLQKGVVAVPKATFKRAMSESTSHNKKPKVTNGQIDPENQPKNTKVVDEASSAEKVDEVNEEGEEEDDLQDDPEVTAAEPQSPYAGL